MEGIATIGVYCFDADTFVATLRRAQVARLVDVRQRRGVRGPQFAWANSLRLQALMNANGIDYLHHRELAPTTELRQLQYREDARLGVGKRSREVLAPEYVRRYTAEILDRTPLHPLLEDLAGHRAALLCVECAAGTCHRSLIAQRLAERHGFSVEHLMAPDL